MFVICLHIWRSAVQERSCTCREPVDDGRRTLSPGEERRPTLGRVCLLRCQWRCLLRDAAGVPWKDRMCARFRIRWKVTIFIFHFSLFDLANPLIYQALFLAKPSKFRISPFNCVVAMSLGCSFRQIREAAHASLEELKTSTTVNENDYQVWCHLIPIPSVRNCSLIVVACNRYGLEIWASLFGGDIVQKPSDISIDEIPCRMNDVKSQWCYVSNCRRGTSTIGTSERPSMPSRTLTELSRTTGE